MQSLRYLLLQIRNQDDPMRTQEVECFRRVLDCESDRIQTFDLLTETEGPQALNAVDAVLIGGSGDYSVTGTGDWLDRSLELLQEICERSKPTFASCWGFQAMSRALGGRVVHDPAKAEIGTHHLQLTGQGREDPVFGDLGTSFMAQMGHEDRVDTLPPQATLLASSSLVKNQAFRIEGKPIYGTQFHAELDKAGLIQRVRAYPTYVQYATGMTVEQFAESCQDTPQAEGLIRRFINYVFD